MKKTLLVVLLAVALVAACGGGGGSAPPATSLVPASAVQSIDGFISYLQELVASAADMLEPVDTTNVVGPTDETSEPKVVD
jgi:ABC-type glycerol-3-phosphate transport system substrate-binding protein